LLGEGGCTGNDLRTNRIVWKKRIGTVRDSSPIPLPFKVGKWLTYSSFALFLK
jgi:glucose dehydrogenase